MCCLHLEDFAVKRQHEVKGALHASETSHPKAVKLTNPTILGMAKSALWYILRNKGSTDELSNTKRLVHQQKPTVVPFNCISVVSFKMYYGNVQKQNYFKKLSLSKYLCKSSTFFCMLVRHSVSLLLNDVTCQ